MDSDPITMAITMDIVTPMVEKFNQRIEDIMRRNPNLDRQEVIQIGCIQTARIFIHNLASLQRTNEEAVMFTNRYSKEILEELGLPYVTNSPNG